MITLVIAAILSCLPDGPIKDMAVDAEAGMGQAADGRARSLGGMDPIRGVKCTASVLRAASTTGSRR